MIKKINSGEKCSAKQWAVDMLIGDLENATDYYYERWSHVWDQMTEKEQAEVSRQINALHNRILKMLQKSARKSK